MLGGDWASAARDVDEQAAWWLPEVTRAGSTTVENESRLFCESGVAVMTSGETQVIVDAGPFGIGSAGHSHSDTVSILIRIGVEDILIDPGTYIYVADPAERNAFRGSGAHNTIRVNG